MKTLEKKNYPKNRKSKATGKAAITVTGHTSRDEYMKEYGRLYREKNRQYFCNYYHQNKDKYKVNTLTHVLATRAGALWLTYKNDIQELEEQLKQLKQLNKELLNKIKAELMK